MLFIRSLWRALTFIIAYSTKFGLAFVFAIGLFILVHLRAPSLIIWLNTIVESLIGRATDVGLPEWFVALAITLNMSGKVVFTIFFVLSYFFVLLLWYSYSDKGRFK